MSSASGIKLELTKPTDALSIRPKSMFAVPSINKSFHSLVLDPKLTWLSTPGIKLEDIKAKDAVCIGSATVPKISIWAVPSINKSLNSFPLAPKL